MSRPWQPERGDLAGRLDESGLGQACPQVIRTLDVEYLGGLTLIRGQTVRHDVFVLIVLVAIILPACSDSPAPTSVPAVPSDVTIRVKTVDTFCPTENEQARRFYNDALELAEQGKLEDAKQLYLQAVELDPGYCDAMDNLGRLLRSQGKVDEAISWYKRSIKLLPNNTVAHQNLALAYGIQSKMTDAVAEYQLLVQIDPNNPEGYYGLGTIHLELKQPQEAVTQLKKAEELYTKQSSPLISDARYALGVSYYALQKWENARNYFELIYSEMQDNPRVNYFLGLCYLSPEIYNLELGKRYLRKAQELGVDLPADVLRRIGK